MNTTRILFISLYILLASQTHAQQSKLDSIQDELIKTLKQIEFYYRDGISTYPGSSIKLVDKPYYARLKSPTDVSINEDYVTLIFKNRTRRLSLLNDRIHSNSEYIIYFYPPIGSGYTKSGYLWGDLLFFNKQPMIVQKEYLYQIKLNKTNEQEEFFNTELIKFKSKIELNRTSISINQIPEEQHKFIVQANAANEEKYYTSALELYKKAMEINEFSYPQGYYNMAIIAAQINNYAYAIFYMKKYILLEPIAEDARKAQDKIYEWEMKMEY